MPFAKLFDASRCTGCRGCQAACKIWNQDPTEKTANLGSYQNPPDVSHMTRTIIKYKETDIDDTNRITWTFLKESCRHCIEPPCMYYAGEAPDMIRVTDTGAVVYGDKTATVDDLRSACPYDIPRQEKPGSPYVKCTLCFDRVANGLKPACVSTCPSGALEFGPREEIIKLAEERIAAIKARYPNARLHGDYKNVSFIYLLTEKDADYEKLASVDHADVKRHAATRRDILNPRFLKKGISSLLKA